MKVSESWLREWVNPSLTGQQLAAQLTLAGLEVEAFSPVAGEFHHVIVAKVISTSAHPQADKLTLCQVDAGDSRLIQVVCGATNVRAGLKVALALPGADLPGGVHIKDSKLRGEVSQGMLCSSSELGIEERSEGIIELPEDAPIGMDLRDYLGLNDYVFDIDLTPNRADCFSLVGIARDVAAINRLTCLEMPKTVMQPTIDETMNVHLKAPAACPQYCGRIMRGINPQAKTPLWMQERLRRSGIRSLHPVVDVTNYVMLELGQPMHAFDLKTIQGDIQVRHAQTNEHLVLLDGQDVVLNEQILVIADDSSPLAMAGVMGGMASAVHEHTTDIFLESAFFDPVSIAGVARRFGLSSESSQRYERGVDPDLQLWALERATCLLHAIVGGQIGPATRVSKATHLPSKVSVLFRPAQVKQLSGLEIEEDEMFRMLTCLGMTVEKKSSGWQVDVPMHRFDISLEVDLVEEIIRLHGYDKIPALPILSVMQAGKINPMDRVLTRSADFLCGRGYHETISYSFVDPQLQSAIYPDAETLQLLNPISSELSQMRAGMWPGLLASVVYNMHRQQTALKFFEAGVVFDVNSGELTERACLAGLMTGESGSLNWSESTHTFDFYDLKGDLQALFSALNLNNIRFVKGTHSALHPGQSAQIFIDDKAAGWIGVLHPRLLDALDLTSEVILFELTLSKLMNEELLTYQRISKYPQTRRDLSLLVDVEINAAQIEQAVYAVVAKDCLQALNIFDVYTGESIPTGKKSLAIALTLQNDSRTLIDSEINAIISNILAKLQKEFSITLRFEIEGS